MANCDLPYPVTTHQWIAFFVFFTVHSLVELWLGKSTKTQASSILEAAFLGIVWIMNKFSGRKPK